MDILKAMILHIGLWGSPKAIGFHVGLMFHKSNEIGDKTLERESHISHWPILLLYFAVVLNRRNAEQLPLKAARPLCAWIMFSLRHSVKGFQCSKRTKNQCIQRAQNVVEETEVLRARM
jgi:hypothetical protein